MDTTRINGEIGFGQLSRHTILYLNSPTPSSTSASFVILHAQKGASHPNTKESEATEPTQMGSLGFSWWGAESGAAARRVRTAQAPPGAIRHLSSAVLDSFCTCGTCDTCPNTTVMGLSYLPSTGQCRHICKTWSLWDCHQVRPSKIGLLVCSLFGAQMCPGFTAELPEPVLAPRSGRARQPSKAPEFH